MAILFRANRGNFSDNHRGMKLTLEVLDNPRDEKKAREALDIPEDELIYVQILREAEVPEADKRDEHV